jgi:FlaA1/EpsC-like NDP-sugar epimerase
MKTDVLFAALQCRLLWVLRRWHQIVVDSVVLGIAFTLAYLLRFDFAIPVGERWGLLTQLSYVVVLQLIALIAAGVYSFLWRYISMSDVPAFVWAAVLWSVPILGLRCFLPDSVAHWRVPLSVMLADAALAVCGVLGARMLRRTIYEWVNRNRLASQSKSVPQRILLVGAGKAGQATVEELLSEHRFDYEIKGFVDDDPRKENAVIQGIRVIGKTRDLPYLLRSLKITQIIITVRSATRRQIKRILELCDGSGVKVQIIPSVSEVVQNQVTVSRIRDVNIADLLGRKPISLGEEHVRAFLEGKCVMITGAGGSIGSELARQVAQHNPANLLLVERSEPSLFSTECALRREQPNARITPLLADVCNTVRMAWIFSEYRPQVVLHAAAHKHVPMMELNIPEAVTNNVFGTRKLADLATTYKAEAFVLISTDKAVRPTSIMGTSKRIAELVIQDMNRRSTTRFVAVRFGNVIGSGGSVIPIFQEQIRRGGPVTVTHPDMTRYFMTIPEAAQLVLESAAMGEGGEIFILDMGEPVRIQTLAEDLISLSGLRPHEDIEIRYSGIRPGEKLYEELQTHDERLSKTRHPKIFIGNIAGAAPEVIQTGLQQLSQLAEAGDGEAIRHLMAAIVPEASLFRTDETTPVFEQPSVQTVAYSAS